MTQGSTTTRTIVVLAAGRARRYGGVKPLAPVGPAGEAVIDLAASDALDAGFDTIVLVVGPSTGPAIRYHVEHTWPSWVNVHFALQEVPLGTVDAVMAAGHRVDRQLPFAVANADDLYGPAGLASLAEQLAAPAVGHMLVGYRLRHAMVGDSPVTRGICQVDDQGLLVAIEERRQVFALGDDRFVAKDGRQPAEVDGGALVSMNLWGFAPSIWEVLDEAMRRARHASEEAEVLLPEMVGQMVLGEFEVAGDDGRFRVVPTQGRCIGVTHPADLALVQADLAGQVGRGERPAQLWTKGR